MRYWNGYQWVDFSEDVPLKCCPRYTWGDGTHDLDCKRVLDITEEMMEQATPNMIAIEPLTIAPPVVDVKYDIEEEGAGFGGEDG